MAKTSESKNEVRKMQKEIAALKNKLKAAEKHSTTSEKNWQKKHGSYQKEMEKKLASVYQAGYSDALLEAERKEMARKKVLQTAEVTFEKGYRKAGKAGKAGKKAVKPVRATKGAKKARAIKATRLVKGSRKTTAAAATKAKAPKSAKLAQVKKVTKAATSARVGMKKRGRPPKMQQKQERSKGMEGHQFTHHDELSLNHDYLSPQRHDEMIK